MTTGLTVTPRPNIGTQRVGELKAIFCKMVFTTSATYVGTGTGVVISPNDFGLHSIEHIAFELGQTASTGGFECVWDETTSSVRVYQSDDAVDGLDEETAIDATLTVKAIVYGT